MTEAQLRLFYERVMALERVAVITDGTDSWRFMGLHRIEDLRRNNPDWNGTELLRAADIDAIAREVGGE